MYNNRYIFLGAKVSEERLLKALEDAREMSREYEAAHPGTKCEISAAAGSAGKRGQKTIIIEIRRPEPGEA